MCSCLVVSIESPVLMLLVVPLLDEVADPQWGVGLPGGGVDEPDEIT